MFLQSKKRGFGSSIDLRPLELNWKSRSGSKTLNEKLSDFEESCLPDEIDKRCSLPNFKTESPVLRRRHSFSSMEMMTKLLKNTVGLDKTRIFSIIFFFHD